MIAGKSFSMTCRRFFVVWQVGHDARAGKSSLSCRIRYQILPRVGLSDSQQQNELEFTLRVLNSDSQNETDHDQPPNVTRESENPTLNIKTNSDSL